MFSTVHGKYLVGENLVKKATVSAYAIYVFHVSVNIGEENFGKWFTIRQIYRFSPLPKFSRTVFSAMNYCYYVVFILSPGVLYGTFFVWKPST